ncbi:hypothetical protein CMEL01_16801, partial [Colletotrichum melonis]
MPHALHRASKSARSAVSGVMTMVTPSAEQNAGSMNDKLLPPPVPRTWTTGLCPL